MRKLFESGISIIVALSSLGLCVKWYLKGQEIEPLIGIVASTGVLLTAAVYLFFPEKKEEANPSKRVGKSKKVMTGLTVFGNIINGDGNIINNKIGLWNISNWLKIGAVFILMIVILAIIPQISDYWVEESKDIGTTSSKTDTLNVMHTVQQQAKSSYVEPQKKVQDVKEKRKDSTKNQFESYDQSKQTNVPDNKGTIIINQ